MNFKQESEILTPGHFCILLSLAEGERHGYDIVKQIEQDSCGRVIIERGNLYATMKRLLKAGLIEGTAERSKNELDHERRRYYRITSKGKKRLVQELERYAKAIALARERNLC